MSQAEMHPRSLDEPADEDQSVGSGPAWKAAGQAFLPVPAGEPRRWKSCGLLAT